MGLLRRVDGYARWPTGYGLAWFDPVTHVTTCAPVPLNIVLGLVHRAWVWLEVNRWGRHDVIIAAYQRGRHDQADLWRSRDASREREHQAIVGRYQAALDAAYVRGSSRELLAARGSDRE